MAVSRRFPPSLPELAERQWNDVRGPLYRYLRALWDGISGIPGGFKGTTPNPTGAEGDPGTENASWMAADAVIPQGIVTTKGDLLGFSDEPERVTVGTNGYVLTADSAQDLGVAWQPPNGASRAFVWFMSRGRH
jgi:hypothetical protein